MSSPCHQSKTSNRKHFSRLFITSRLPMTSEQFLESGALVFLLAISLRTANTDTGWFKIKECFERNAEGAGEPDSEATNPEKQPNRTPETDHFLWCYYHCWTFKATENTPLTILEVIVRTPATALDDGCCRYSCLGLLQNDSFLRIFLCIIIS